MEKRKNKIEYRILIGVLLILGGLLGLLEKLGFIDNASGFFWATIFLLAGVGFSYIFLTNREHWWSIIPGSSLFGLAITVGLPEELDRYGGLAFLGALGLGFLVIYIVNRKHWWTLIPSGVLLSLGLISSVSNELQGQDTGSLFFIGLGLTFLLVALLPTGSHRMSWAFIPASILLIIGTLLGTTLRSLFDYIWIGALFVGGFYMIWLFFTTRKH